MTSAIDPAHAAADRVARSLDTTQPPTQRLPSRQISYPSFEASPGDARLLDFVEWSQREKASESAPFEAIANAVTDIDSQRSFRIRAFFDSFNVQVPVLVGRPGETRNVAVPFRLS